MGVVWRATDTVLDRVVALKRVVLPEDPTQADGLRARVRREARVAARLQHPGLVGIFDVIQPDGDEPWLVLEYVPSRDLATMVGEQGPWAPAAVAVLGVTLADALAAVHEAGIVHRDVKPANVLVGASVVKLTDFGISRGSGDLTLTASGALMGTPAFLAPEVALGQPATQASDVFGLGATLYAAVEGTSPYGDAGGSLLAVLRRAGDGQIRPPQRAGALTELLWRLLHPDPARRPSAAQARALLAEVARPAAPPEPAETANVPVRVPGGRARQWWRALVTGGAAVLVTVLVVVLLPGLPFWPTSDPGEDAADVAACDTSRGELAVGLIAPLTGDLSALGVDMRNAAELAVRQANAACTVPGYLLRLQPEDDRSLPQSAETAAAGTTVLVAAAASAIRASGTWDAGLRPVVVRAVQDTRVGGAIGPIAFDEFGDLVDPSLTVYRLADGSWDAISTGS